MRSTINTGKKLLSERLLKIDSVALIQARIWAIVEVTAQELTIPEESQYDILDWCVCELYSQALTGLDIRVLRHWRDDEGKIVLDQMTPKEVKAFTDSIRMRYERYRGSLIKIMISGTNALVSIERKLE